MSGIARGTGRVSERTRRDAKSSAATGERRVGRCSSERRGAIARTLGVARRAHRVAALVGAEQVDVEHVGGM